MADDTVNQTQTTSEPEAAAAPAATDDRITTVTKYVTTDGEELANEEEALLHQAIVDAKTRATNVATYLKAQIPEIEGDLLSKIEGLFSSEVHLSAISNLLADTKPAAPAAS